ncbi:MAG: sigma-54-dependent Fis family transcriptional regulator [Chitinophagia bacterium]|jgi:DNA-binding NtrC family response regulator|nr:sigma-54-dependent Fis family transcriptional regulator [Chitinophagia bacterium]
MNIQSVKQRYGIVGHSEQLERALGTALRVAPTDLTVLITGESGVGKEVISKIIHEYSSRKHNTFIAINTGAIPEGTINSELFGHEKGAFTGATSERKGYFETVNQGTIFLDEIGDMPLDTQAFLLRILESGEYIKVGSSKVQKTDVRIIAATNVDLTEKVKAGKFREDLYYRLNTVPIRVPALHERREDIPILFRKFASDFADKYRTEILRLDETAKALLSNYRWPGNIRELRNLVEQLCVLSENPVIDVERLLELAPQLATRNLPAKSDAFTKENFEEREILYKFLFEMKNDINDLKRLVFELVQRNNLEMPSLPSRSFSDFGESLESAPRERTVFESKPDEDYEKYDDSPVLINNQTQYSKAEEVEESLSLEEKTKELILKALKKHKGRRKDAADELGISERTLYRKIKEYDIAI